MFSLGDITEEYRERVDENVGTRRGSLLLIKWSQDVIYQQVKEADLFFRTISFVFFHVKKSSSEFLVESPPSYPFFFFLLSFGTSW